MLFCLLVPPLSVCIFHLQGQIELPLVQSSQFMWRTNHSFGDKSLEEDKQTHKSSCHTLDWKQKKTLQRMDHGYAFEDVGGALGHLNGFIFSDFFTSSQQSHPTVLSRIAKQLYVVCFCTCNFSIKPTATTPLAEDAHILCSFFKLCFLNPRALIWQVNFFSVSRWTDNVSVSTPVTYC